MENIFLQIFKQVALIAPAGRAEREDVALSVDLLEKAGLQVKVMPHVFSDTDKNSLPATLKERLQDLHACWRDKSIDLIFCVRGGCGSAQLLPHIDWNLLRTRKIPFVGYSDITALHMGMLRQRVGTPIVAPMPVVFNEALFENDENQYTRHFMHLALADNIPAGTELYCPGNEDFNIMKSGYALGLPVVANLSVLTSLCGTKWFPKLRHRILIIEDLNEPLYKIDRYLTQLLQCGALADCEALLFGQFNNCGEEKGKYELFKRFAENIKGPVIVDFPFGHNFPSISLNMRHHLRIEKNAKIFIIDS
ncbi:MAG: LD-carboxypeptidase [Victivallaceae bacterium]|nr:LD-carboxypeptidase [Victivallaceae bacterium]